MSDIGAMVGKHGAGRGVVFIALVALLSACSKSPALPPAAAAASPAPTPTLRDPMPRTGADAASATVSATAKPDTALPLDRYTPLPPIEQNPLGYIKAAYYLGALTDEQKLVLVSPRYAAEPDAFKRHDLFAAEQRVMSEHLPTYASQRYYAVPVGEGHPLKFSGPSSGVSFLLGPYDFDRKGFPIGRQFAGQPGCTAMEFPTIKQVQSPTEMQAQIMAGKQPSTLGFVPIQIVASVLPCILPIADEATAKRIEEARNAGHGVASIVITGGTLFLFVNSAFDDGIRATVVHAHLSLSSLVLGRPKQEPLAEVDL